MSRVGIGRRVVLAAGGVVLATLVAGCQTGDRGRLVGMGGGSSSGWPPSGNLRKPPAFTAADVPRELQKVCLPDYRVEPPDILLIEAVRAVPKPPYRAEPLDVLYIDLAEGLPNEPLRGLFTVEPDGTINLGLTYGGTIQVRGMTLPEIRAAVVTHLRTTVKLKDPVVTVSLVQSRAGQRVTGSHLVRPDGTIFLGTYGSVRVAGLTLREVKAAVEAKLGEFLVDPEVTVDVAGYNSKLYYVILDGAGAGQTVIRLPVTGNETVLDALSQVSGLSAVSSADRIWVSRPAPAGYGHQVMPVDWRAITELGDTTTNYQLLPGDRVFVGAYPLIALDIRMGRVIAPIERALGVTLLGNSVYRSLAAPLPTATNVNNATNGTTGVFIP